MNSDGRTGHIAVLTDKSADPSYLLVADPLNRVTVTNARLEQLILLPRKGIMARLEHVLSSTGEKVVFARSSREGALNDVLRVPDGTRLAHGALPRVPWLPPSVRGRERLAWFLGDADEAMYPSFSPEVVAEYLRNHTVMPKGTHRWSKQLADELNVLREEEAQATEEPVLLQMVARGLRVALLKPMYEHYQKIFEALYPLLGDRFGKGPNGNQNVDLLKIVQRLEGR